MSIAKFQALSHSLSSTAKNACVARSWPLLARLVCCTNPVTAFTSSQRLLSAEKVIGYPLSSVSCPAKTRRSFSICCEIAAIRRACLVLRLRLSDSKGRGYRSSKNCKVSTFRFASVSAAITTELYFAASCLNSSTVASKCSRKFPQCRRLIVLPFTRRIICMFLHASLYIPTDALNAAP